MITKIPIWNSIWGFFVLFLIEILKPEKKPLWPKQQNPIKRIHQTPELKLAQKQWW